MSRPRIRIPLRSPRLARLLLYFAVTFGISWTIWIPLAATESGNGSMVKDLAAFGPSLAAIVLAWRAGTLRSLLRSLVRWRVGLRWYLLALAGPPAVVLLAIGLYAGGGGRGLSFNDPANWYLGLFAFSYVLVLGGPLGEELGWRGYALPRLIDKMGERAASLTLGVVWAIWHLPLAFIPGTPQAEVPFALFAALTVSLSVIYARFWTATGSVLIVILLHAASNTAAGIFPLLPRDADGSLWPFTTLVGLAMLGAAIASRPRRRGEPSRVAADR